MSGYVDTDVEVAWIAEHCDLKEIEVATVLAVEMEFMAGVGNAVPPAGYRFVWYKAEDLAAEPKCVETLRLAQDVERFTGIPERVAHQVFAAEIEFLRLRGLV